MKKTWIGYFLYLAVLGILVLLSLFDIFSFRVFLLGLLIILVILQLLTSGFQLLPMSDAERFTIRMKAPKSKQPLMSGKQLVLILFPLVIAVCILQLS